MSENEMKQLAGMVAESIYRDAERWRWLVAQHNVSDLPIAQVVWKRGSNPKGEWVNLIDGHDLIAHVDHALVAPSSTKQGEGK
jgi:hypothetical protein